MIKIKLNEDFVEEEKNGIDFIKFKEEYSYIKITFKTKNTFKVKIYEDLNFLDEKEISGSEGEYPSVEFYEKKINRISFPASKGTIVSIEVNRGNDCDLNGFEKIHTIEYSNRFLNFDFDKFFEGCYNFYLPEREYGKYIENFSNGYYQGLVKKLRLGSSSRVNLSKKDRDNYDRFLGLFFMIIMDPNIARILGLYYIDKSISETEKYSYKVIANYQNKGQVCGSVFNLGKIHDPLPEVKGLSVTQSNESYFNFSNDYKNFEQQGTTILKWQKPVEYKNTNPVSFFFHKLPDLQLSYGTPDKNIIHYGSAKGKLILPIEEKDNPGNNIYYDRMVKVEKEKYLSQHFLFGIDLFGRVGPPGRSVIPISDKSLPSVPVNLKIKERQSQVNIDGQPKIISKYFLQFSFGAMQYLNSPDCLNFKVLKKDTSKKSKQKVKYLYSGDNLGYKGYKGIVHKHIFRIEITEPDFEIKDANGAEITFPLSIQNNFSYIYFQFSDDENNKILPAKDRKKFRISKILKDNRIEIESENNSYEIKNTGYGYIFSNPDIPKAWIDTGLSQNFVKPVELDLSVIESDNYISAKILYSRIVDIPVFDEAGRNDKTKKCNEIYVNRSIFESGIFEEGTIRKSSGNAGYKILAQASVFSSYPSEIDEPDMYQDFKNQGIDLVTKLLIEGSITFDTGSSVRLFPKLAESHTLYPFSEDERMNSVVGLVKLYFNNNLNLPISNEGELLLSAKLFKNIEGDYLGIHETIPLTAKLLSDIKSSETGLKAEALVFISKRVNKILASPKVFYFRNYEVDITAHSKLDIQPGKGNASAYFTVQSIDESDQHNKSGLALPVQYVDYIKVIPGSPASVYLCGTDPSNPEKVYLSLPNKEGRSSVCLQWAASVSPNSEHLRYELTRALDVSIISALKAKWMINDTPEAVRPFLSDVTLKENLTIKDLSLNESTGIYSAQISNDALTQDERKQFISTRTIISNRYFCVTGFVDSKILFRLLTPLKSGTANKTGNTNINLESLADLQKPDLMNNIDSIKMIADKCPEAFSMVTKVPVRGTSFTDNVPGQGHGKYFYKVRAVDPAENRSPWSECSGAFYQVDIKIPEVPQDFNVETGDRCSRLLWRKANLNNSFERYEIFRFENDQEQIFAGAYATISGEPVPFRKVRSMLGSIVIPQILNFPIVTGTTDMTGTPEGILQQRIALTKSLLSISIQTIDNPVNLYTNLSDFEITHQKIDENNIIIKTIRDKNGKVPDGIPLRVMIGDNLMERDENWFEFFDGGLVGSNNYFYAIRRIDKIGYSMNGVLQEKEVNGDSTSLLKIVAIDKSVPEKPIIKEINWLKDGTSNSDFIPDSRPKFTVKVTSKPSKVLIQKRKIGTDKWEVLSIEISVGETIEVKKEYIDWDSDLLTKDLTEAVFYDEIGYDYRAKLIGVNNLSSEYSEIISIN
ncbi:MAG: hypothetical protein WAT71_14730 [Ignavibacteria bacterium]